MKNPLWILNSTLAVLLIAVALYIILSLNSINETPPLVSIKPLAKVELYQKERPKPQDIKFIYEENDLFHTYRSQEIIKKPETKVPPLPTPPAPKPIVSQPTPTVQFLEPLPIKISGIITSSNEAKSHVTIVDTNTKKSESYKLGDKLFDAYVVRILPNKIILIRSNGQQETIFKSPEDAQAEIKSLQDTSWIDVVEKKSENLYIVNPTTFTARVSSLAQLIDILDATTAFKNGISIGSRIGKIQDKSLGYALGFRPGDIITSINSISPTTTTNRVNIYNAIYSLPLGSKIIVDILRYGKKLVHEYILQTKNKPDEKVSTQISKEIEKAPEKNIQLALADQDIKSEHVKILKEKRKLNPMISNLQKRDKQAMRYFGSRNSLLKDCHSKG